MNITVTCEHILHRMPDGAHWVQGAPLSFWERYLEAFDDLVIVGRVRTASEPPAGAEPLAHPRVSVAAIPFYRGPVQFARRALAVRRALRAAADGADALLMRVPSTLANVLAPMMQRAGRPYAVEVLGDPHDVFGPGVVQHPLRPLFRWWYDRSQRRQCAGAAAAAYVTQSRLQERYPASPDAWQTHYSSLALADEAFVPQPRPAAAFVGPPFRLITIAKLAQMYKGVDVLIDAIAACAQHGLDLRLEVIGDGAFREQLERQSASLGVADRICFRGHVASGKPVYDLLDGADLFVLPSRTEGLPRSMIEAMARALPCIGSTAGGIPELLPPELMVPPGDALALAAKLASVFAYPARLAELSARNRAHADHFRPEKLRARRLGLYQQLRQLTERWQIAPKNPLAASRTATRSGKRAAA